MGMQGYSTTEQRRLGRFAGAIVGHAVPKELLARQGRQITRTLPLHEGDTYVGRRFLPWGALATNANSMNQFFQNGTGDRTAAIVIAHQVAEGETPDVDSVTPMDMEVTIKEYACLYGYTNRTADLFEDDIPAQMKIQVGERTAFVNEQILYGYLKAGTNQFFGGTGTTIATVNGPITLGMLRKITKSMDANHATAVSRMLAPSGDFNTASVLAGWFVYIHSDAAPDIRDLPNFLDAKDYASGKPVPGEMGAVEEFRFIKHPDLPSRQDAGAAVGSTNLYSTSGSNIDVYQFIVAAQDAFSQLALRGKNSVEPTFLPVGQKVKADPFGQRGYVGAKWWKAALIENNGWMAVGNVGVKNLA